MRALPKRYAVAAMAGIAAVSLAACGGAQRLACREECNARLAPDTCVSLHARELPARRRADLPPELVCCAPESVFAHLSFMASPLRP